MRPTEYTVVPYHPADLNMTNDDRAKMIVPFVEAYRRAYYFHLVDGEPSEPFETVIGDMIGNLLHLADRCDTTGSEVHSLGWMYYSQECDEEDGQDGPDD